MNVMMNKEEYNMNNNNYNRIVSISTDKRGLVKVNVPGIVGVCKHTSKSFKRDKEKALAFANKLKARMWDTHVYLAWCKTQGLFKNVDVPETSTQEPFIRKVSGGYGVYIPQENRGCPLFPCKNGKYAKTMMGALVHRNQCLYNMLKTSKDKYGQPLSIDAIRTYKRVLCEGYFKTIILRSNRHNWRSEDYKNIQARNAAAFANAFENAAKVSDGELANKFTLLANVLGVKCFEPPFLVKRELGYVVDFLESIGVSHYVVLSLKRIVGEVNSTTERLNKKFAIR